MKKGKVCFFSTVPYNKLLCENYSIQDIRILQDLGYEVIVTNNFFKIPINCNLYFSWWASGTIIPLIKALLFKIPIICIAGGNEVMSHKDSLTGTESGYLNQSFFKKFVVKFVLKYSTRVVIVSNFMRHDVLKLGAKNPTLIYNCVDTEIFKPIEKNKQSYILSIFKLDDYVIENKRGYIYLNAISKVIAIYPNQKFIIIGRFGNEHKRFINFAKDINIDKNITFIDEIPNSKILNYIQNSELYVQISDTETFGLTIAEAMSCGIPVLVSKRGAIPEVVGDSGIFVNHNSINSVAEQIINFLKLPELNKIEISKNLRNRIVANFSYSLRKNEIKSLISSIIYE